MRTFRCWDEVVDPVNVWHAWLDFARGKRGRLAVAAFDVDAPTHVLRLARALRAETWSPGPVRVLRITDPKRRVVAAAPVGDRVVHHALYRVLAPRLDRSFVAHTYACVPGRGSHRAVLRFQASLRRWRHALHLDVARYFYNIDRELLRRLVCERLREEPARRLVAAILDGAGDLYRRPDVVEFLGRDGPAPVGKGLPIGNLTSQWWANHYLSGLDHFATRELRVEGYQRYMDDITFFGNDVEGLVEARDAVARWLAEQRGLFLKAPVAWPFRTDRWHAYLGYRTGRPGVAPGPKMRQRVGGLAGHVLDSEKLGAAITATAAVWTFG